MKTYHPTHGPNYHISHRTKHVKKLSQNEIWLAIQIFEKNEKINKFLSKNLGILLKGSPKDPWQTLKRFFFLENDPTLANKTKNNSLYIRLISSKRAAHYLIQPQTPHCKVLLSLLPQHISWKSMNTFQCDRDKWNTSMRRSSEYTIVTRTKTKVAVSWVCSHLDLATKRPKKFLT